MGDLWKAKVHLDPSPERPGYHPACVYTEDAVNVRQVRVAGRVLRRLGLVTVPIYYKPDRFSYAGIYSRDRTSASIFRLSPNGRLELTAGFGRLPASSRARIEAQLGPAMAPVSLTGALSPSALGRG